MYSLWFWGIFTHLYNHSCIYVFTARYGNLADSFFRWKTSVQYVCWRKTYSTLSPFLFRLAVALVPIKAYILHVFPLISKHTYILCTQLRFQWNGWCYTKAIFVWSIFIYTSKVYIHIYIYYTSYCIALLNLAKFEAPLCWSNAVSELIYVL